MNTEQIALAAAILLAAYFIRGITGFGSGLIAVPLLALFLPLKFVVPLMLLLDFTASIVIGGLHFKKVQWNEISILFPFSLVGVTLGTHLLVRLPQAPMLITLAAFIMIFAVRSLLNWQSDKPVSRFWAIPASLTGGTVGGLFGTGGPPYVIYLAHRIRDKGALRASLSATFFVEGLMRIASFLLAGLLMTKQLWMSYLVALPIVLAALYAGNRAHIGLDAARMTQLIGGLLMVSGISLLVKAGS